MATLTSLRHGSSFVMSREKVSTLAACTCVPLSVIAEMIIMIYFAEFDSIYKRLGVVLIERGESFYQSMMEDVVADLESKSKLSIVR